MSDVNDAAAQAEPESKRKQVSKRDYLDSAGVIVSRIEEAAGARYSLVQPDPSDSEGKRLIVVKSFDQQFGEAGKLATMCGIFGFHTKVGNVANTVLNDKDDPGTPEDAAKAIEEFLAAAAGGTWAERSEGGVCARIDEDALAGSIVTVAEAAGKQADYAKIRERLETDKQYVRMARQVPDVATEYARRVGKATKSVDDLI